MKAYPTVYKGTRYRSRLEATWACFFDLLGLPFVYEPFDTAGYAPDFLVGNALLCEVKPFAQQVLDDGPIVEAREAVSFAAGTQYQAALLGVDHSVRERAPWDLELPLCWELGAGDLFARLGPVLGSRPLRYVGTQDFPRIWGTARSRVQWKPKHSEAR